MPESNIPISNNPPSFCGSIEISNDADFEIDEQSICETLGAIISDAGFKNGLLSIAIVDDPTIHKLNVQYLDHDYETDVLSFVLTADESRSWLEGEVIASYDTARRVAAELGWEVMDELLLYLIHGTLHLIGMDDKTDELRAAMRAAETKYLARSGRQRPASDGGG